MKEKNTNISKLENSKELNNSEQKTVFMPTPKQLYAYLNDYVIGQDEAKKTLAVAIYNHFKRFMINIYGAAKDVKAYEKFKDVTIEKANVMILGNSGTGKSYMIKILCKFLNIPCYIADCNTLSETGYVGDDVENVIVGLLKDCNYNVEQAQCGVVVLDECFDGDTEVMTDKGFIPFKYLSKDDKIMQWNDDFTMDIVKSERIVKHKCSGKMLSLINSKNHIKIHTSTPNHNRVVICHGKDEKKYLVKKVVAEESTMQGYSYPVTGIFNGKEIEISDDMLRLIVAFATDGCLENFKYGYITFKKEQKYKRLIEILNNLGINYTYTFDEKRRYHNFYLGDVTSYPFIKNGKKNMCLEELITASLRQKEIFIKELKFWDGYVNNEKKDCVFFSSSKLEEMRFVQTIAHTSGMVFSIRARKKEGYENCYYGIARKKKDMSQSSKINKSFYTYDGDVYCVTVPSGMIMIRQGNFVTVTGNCDKLSRKGENVSITRDVGGEGVQQNLLKLVEGGVVAVPPNGGRKHPEQQCIDVDTTNILFIALGAFEGIDKIISKRLNTNRIGFKCKHNPNKEDNFSDEENLLDNVMADDLRKYGIIPELLGRFPIITHTNPLTEEDMMKILTDTKSSVVKQYQKLLSIDNIDLQFTDDAIKEIAKQSLVSKTGARGIKKIMENLLSDIMFEYGGNTKKKTITIDKNYVDNFYIKKKVA